MTLRKILHRLVGAALVAASVLCATPALAQDPPQPPRDFQKMVPGTSTGQETLAAGPLVYGAYAAVWVVLLAYFFILWRRASRLEHDVATLEHRLKR